LDIPEKRSDLFITYVPPGFSNQGDRSAHHQKKNPEILVLPKGICPNMANHVKDNRDSVANYNNGTPLKRRNMLNEKNSGSY